MRNYRNLVLVFSLFLLFFCYNCFADFSPTVKEYWEVGDFVNVNQIVDDKFYLESETVHIASRKIFVNLSGHLLPVTHLFSDEIGVFVLVEEILGAQQSDYWKCKYCGELNEGGRYCSTCTKPRK